MANQTGRRNNVYEFKHPDHNRNRRMQEQRRRVARKRRVRRLAVLAFGVLVGIIILSLSIWLLVRKNGQAIYVGGVPVGTIKGFDYSAEDLQNLAEAKIIAEVGTKIQVDKKVTVESVHSNAEFNDYNFIVSEVVKNLSYKQEAAIITVDGIDMATVKSKAEADNILDKIKRSYDKEGQNIIDWDIVDDYTVASKFVSTDEIISSEMARNILTKQTEVEETYIVASGDSLWQLAADAGMTLEKLLQINEGYTVDTPIVVGQEIKLVVQKPLLSVRTVEEVKTNELKRRDIDYHENPSMPSTYKKTISVGRDGQMTVTYHVIRINGLMREQQKMYEDITVYPINDIIEIGTKN